jgi:dihydroorotase
MKRLYRHGHIASEESSQLLRADVLVEGDRIIGVAPEITGIEGTEVIDCTGRILLPALFDAHVHGREPGQENKETIATCAAAAINGGITGIVLQPNTTPAIDTASLVTTVLDKGRKTPINVLTTGAITKGRKSEELAPIGAMKAAGAVMITDGGDPLHNPQLLRIAMEYAKDFDLPLASHCEVKELAAGGHMHEGSVSYSLGLGGIPACSEEICLERDIRLAQFTGAHLHLQHVSTAIGLKAIERAKNDGVDVTCEVTPHHLMFNHHHIGNYDTNYKVNPPLRTPEDNASLLKGLIDGLFDVIVTDHAPHTEFEKNNDFASAPFGIAGLETALPALFDRFIATDLFGWDLLVKRYSAEPRRLLKLKPVPIVEGGVAEFIVFNPGVTTTFSRDFMKSKSINTPFLNQTLKGLVERVIYQGNEILAR